MYASQLLLGKLEHAWAKPFFGQKSVRLQRISTGIGGIGSPRCARGVVVGPGARGAKTVKIQTKKKIPPGPGPGPGAGPGDPGQRPEARAPGLGPGPGAQRPPAAPVAHPRHFGSRLLQAQTRPLKKVHTHHGARLKAQCWLPFVRGHNTGLWMICGRRGPLNVLHVDTRCLVCSGIGRATDVDYGGSTKRERIF